MSRQTKSVLVAIPLDVLVEGRATARRGDMSFSSLLTYLLRQHCDLPEVNYGAKSWGGGRKKTNSIFSSK